VAEGTHALRFAPRLPAEWDTIRVRQIRVGGENVALTMRRSPEQIELEIENSGAPLTLTFRPELEHGARPRG